MAHELTMAAAVVFWFAHSRRRLVKAKRLVADKQVDIRVAVAGQVRAADIDSMQEGGASDGASESGEESECEGQGRNVDPEAEARVAAAVQLEEAARRRRLARIELIAERGLAIGRGLAVRPLVFFV